MLDQPQRQRQAPDLETNTAPDQLRDDLRRRDQQQTPPDSVPPRRSRARRGRTRRRRIHAQGGRRQRTAPDPRRGSGGRNARRLRAGNRQARRSGARPLALTWRSKFCCAGMTSISRMAPTRLFGNEAPAAPCDGATVASFRKHPPQCI